MTWKIALCTVDKIVMMLYLMLTKLISCNDLLQSCATRDICWWEFWGKCFVFHNFVERHQVQPRLQFQCHLFRVTAGFHEARRAVAHSTAVRYVIVAHQTPTTVQVLYLPTHKIPRRWGRIECPSSTSSHPNLVGGEYSRMVFHLFC